MSKVCGRVSNWFIRIKALSATEEAEWCGISDSRRLSIIELPAETLGCPVR